MENFISSSCLMSFKFYGINYRLDVVYVDGQPFRWIVSVRTCNHRDESTIEFNEFDDAKEYSVSLVKKRLW